MNKNFIYYYSYNYSELRPTNTVRGMYKIGFMHRLFYIKEQSILICMEELRRSKFQFRYVKSQTRSICKYAITSYTYNIQFVHSDILFEEIILSNESYFAKYTDFNDERNKNKTSIYGWPKYKARL